MKYQNKLLWYLFIALLFCISGCDREASTPNTTHPTPTLAENMEILIIGPYTETCQGFIEQQCYLEFNEENQQWEFFYETIQGFDFEPGYIYRLKVRLEDRGTEIQDVGQYAYHLVEIISKEAASVDERPPRKP